MLTISSISTIALLLLNITPTSAAICRDIRVTKLAQDSPTLFYTADQTTLASIICPEGAPSGPCSIQREQYNFTVERRLTVTNGTVSSEEEDSIFELVEQAWEDQVVGIDGNAEDMRINEDARWIDREREVDATNEEKYEADLFETEPGKTLVLTFRAIKRSGEGTLARCDNETLNGRRVTFEAPFLVEQEETNETEVAGILSDTGFTTASTQPSVAARVTNGGNALMISLSLGVLLAFYL